jgi:preprotein translocase subunit SecD
MSKKWWIKFSLLILVTLTSGLVVLPTFTRINPEKLPFSKKINLGLDLQGGLYLVMGVDFNKVFKEIKERLDHLDQLDQPVHLDILDLLE